MNCWPRKMGFIAQNGTENSILGRFTSINEPKIHDIGINFEVKRHFQVKMK